MSLLKGESIDKLHSLRGPNSVETAPLISAVKKPAPSDKCLTTYFIFFLHGIGHLLPWNFFITAHLYFSTKFTCPPSPAGTNSTCTDFAVKNFENFFSIAAMVPIALMTAVNIWLQSRVQYKYRMIISLIIMMALFTVTIAFVAVPTSDWVDGFFATTLLIVVVLNVASAVFQSSTFGFAGVFPAKYTSIVLSGQASAGVFAAVAQIISLASSQQDPTSSAFGYFAVALLIVIICFMSFFAMLPLRFVKYYLQQTSFRSIKTKQESLVKASVNVKFVDTSVPYWTIFTKIWLYAISVFLVFAVTLSLFPAVISKIQSVNYYPGNPWTDTYFIPLICFLLFNSSDFTGRFITHWITFGSNHIVLFILALTRLVFVPLILLCKYGDHIPVFNSDAFPAVWVTLIGVTNGYLGSVAMVSAPQTLPAEYRETASTIMAFFLSTGLLFGSVFSFAWASVAEHIIQS